MSFRTILINKSSRISLDLNNIVVLYEEEKFYINLDEINTIIIEDPRCNISLKLLTELCEKGINLVLTNSSHMPVGCVTTLYNNARASKKIISQINWQNDMKKILWTEIVKHKIYNQIQTLKLLNKNSKLEILKGYLNALELGDISNREGLASRTYFKELFGVDFKRFNEDTINFTLNYVYQIIRSKIAQEIVANGYNPSLGIFHKSEYNQFNLADDFIEVFRPIVDYFAYQILLNSEWEYLTPSLKTELINILNERIKFQNVDQKIKNSIIFYLQNLFNFLETGDISRLQFPTLT